MQKQAIFIEKLGQKQKISVEEEKGKSQEKKKKKRMKYESSLEFVEKEKDVTKLFRMKQRLNMNI